MATWQWKQLSPPGKPSARIGHAMAYDPVRDEVILHGGNDGAVLDQTWRFKDGTWTQLTPATAPGARYQHAMCWDEANQNIVMFGGDNGAGGFNATTYLWNGTDWTNAAPATSPAGTHSIVHAMVFDRARNYVILWGGRRAGNNLTDETWTWNGATWTQLSPATAPTARMHHMMGWDDDARMVVMFGGDNIVGNGDYVDTWAWNGTNWVQRSPTHALTGEWVNNEFVTVPCSGGILLLGKTPSLSTDCLQLERWDEAIQDWTHQTPEPETAPAACRARAGFRAVWVDSLDGVLLFGGDSAYVAGYYDETWLLSLTRAQYRPPSTRETSADDALSVRAIYDLAESIENYKRYVARWKIITQPFPEGARPTSPSSSTAETIVMGWPGIYIPDGYSRLRVQAGHVRTAGTSTVTWRVYSMPSLYHGPMALDATLLPRPYDSDAIVSQSSSHDIGDARTLTLWRSANRETYLLLTAQNGDGSTQGQMTSLDVTLEFCPWQ